MCSVSHINMVALAGEPFVDPNTQQMIVFMQDAGEKHVRDAIRDAIRDGTASHFGREPVGAECTQSTGLNMLRHCMFQILSAVAECHMHQTIHRNVKWGKFVVNSDGTTCMLGVSNSADIGGEMQAQPLLPRIGQ